MHPGFKNCLLCQTFRITLLYASLRFSTRGTSVRPKHWPLWGIFQGMKPFIIQLLQPSVILKSAVFWGITRRRVVIVYRSFGTTYRSHLHGSRVFFSPLGLLTREDGTDTFSRNVGKQLPHDAV
jgi:hypothetical protein